MNLNEHPDERYILEMERRAAVTDNKLFDSVWQIYRLMTHDTCSQSRNVRCVQQVAEGEGWVEESVIPGPGPRGLSEVVTSIIGVTQRLWPVSLSLPQLSVTADTLLSQSHTQRSVSVGPTLPSDRCQWSNQCFVFLHNISLLRQLQTNVLLCFAWPTDDVVIPTYEGRSNGNIMKVTLR